MKTGWYAARGWWDHHYYDPDAETWTLCGVGATHVPVDEWTWISEDADYLDAYCRECKYILEHSLRGKIRRLLDD